MASEPVVAQAHSPLWLELINRLQIPARLGGGITVSDWRAEHAVRIGGKITVFATPQILSLKLEIGLFGVALRRPLPYQVGNRDVTVAAECIGCIFDVAGQATARLGTQERQAGAPSVVHSGIGADMRAGVKEAGEALRSSLAEAAAELQKASTENVRNVGQQLQRTADEEFRRIAAGLDGQVKQLDEALKQELERALSALGSQLASLSDHFVRDYTPLTHRLRDLVAVAQRVQA